jgi:parvulin-like peptidyl-prolyl isomerase
VVKPNFLKWMVVISSLLFWGSTVFAAEQKLPVIKGQKIVAMVNDEPITIEEFKQELAILDKDNAGKEKASEKKEGELLQRLINSRLMVQEGRRIGLDELPETKNLVDVFSKVTLREMLVERQLKNVKVNEKGVERLYREFVKEWKINSVWIEKEEEAKKAEEELKRGKSFDELAKRLIEDGKAKGGEEKNYLKKKDLNQEISEALSKMEVGSVSPIIPLGKGFVILKLEDIRYPDNPEAKKKAEEEGLVFEKGNVLKKYTDALIEKYAVTRKEVLDSIDYEKKEPGFEMLLKDKRVVAELKGEKPITVAELTEQIRQGLYHGADQAIQSKKINSKKGPTLEEMIYKRVFRKEALRLGIDKTQEYKVRVSNYEKSVVFGAFVEKVIFPDVKVAEEEVKRYYDEHAGKFTYPEMIRIRSIAFGKRGDAEDAIEKLRKGMDYQWFVTHAEGQLDKSTQGLMVLEGDLLTTKSLPEGVQKVVSGARSGDLRLYASPEGYFYVLSIQEVTASRQQPYAEARETVARIVYNEKLQKAVEDWADKLRAVSDVKIYLKQD